MPRWLESQITQITNKGQAETVANTGTNNRTSSGTTSNSGADTVAHGGQNVRTSEGEKASTEHREGTVTEDSVVTPNRRNQRTATVTPTDETTTRTQQAHTLSDVEAGTSAQTQTQIEDAGATVTFKIKLRGGLYNSGSANPSIN